METSVFIHLCRALAISYLFTCIVFYSHKSWVKGMFYAIGCTLFGVNVFLWLVFHKIISPQIITLIGETNTTEASEFLSTFLLNGKGLLSLFILALTIGIIILAEKKRSLLQIKKAVSKRVINTIVIDCTAIDFKSVQCKTVFTMWSWFIKNKSNKCKFFNFIKFMNSV